MTLDDGRSFVRSWLPCEEPARTILAMYFLEDVSQPEIGRRLGMTLASVRKPIVAFCYQAGPKLGLIRWRRNHTQTVRNALRLPPATITRSKDVARCEMHPRGCPNPSRDDAIVADVFRGISQTDLAKRWGISQSRVHQIIRRAHRARRVCFGYEACRQPLSLDEVEKAPGLIAMAKAIADLLDRAQPA